MIGISATALLLATLIAQVVKQWQDRNTKGVSRWFFVGQVGASGLFVIYSALLGSALFTIANTLILISAVAGEMVMLISRRRHKTGH